MNFTSAAGGSRSRARPGSPRTGWRRRTRRRRRGRAPVAPPLTESWCAPSTTTSDGRVVPGIVSTPTGCGVVAVGWVNELDRDVGPAARSPPTGADPVGGVEPALGGVVAVKNAASEGDGGAHVRFLHARSASARRPLSICVVDERLGGHERCSRATAWKASSREAWAANPPQRCSRRGWSCERRARSRSRLRATTTSPRTRPRARPRGPLRERLREVRRLLLSERDPDLVRVRRTRGRSRALRHRQRQDTPIQATCFFMNSPREGNGAGPEIGTGPSWDTGLLLGDRHVVDARFDQAGRRRVGGLERMRTVWPANASGWRQARPGAVAVRGRAERLEDLRRRGRRSRRARKKSALSRSTRGPGSTGTTA
jgi:hypothetical protein